MTVYAELNCSRGPVGRAQAVINPAMPHASRSDAATVL